MPLHSGMPFGMPTCGQNSCTMSQPRAPRFKTAARGHETCIVATLHSPQRSGTSATASMLHGFGCSRSIAPQRWLTPSKIAIATQLSWQIFTQRANSHQNSPILAFNTSCRWCPLPQNHCRTAKKSTTIIVPHIFPKPKAKTCS
jgi:hypothetical protein